MSGNANDDEIFNDLKRELKLEILKEFAEEKFQTSDWMRLFKVSFFAYKSLVAKKNLDNKSNNANSSGSGNKIKKSKIGVSGKSHEYNDSAFYIPFLIVLLEQLVENKNDLGIQMSLESKSFLESILKSSSVAVFKTIEELYISHEHVIHKDDEFKRMEKKNRLVTDVDDFDFKDPMATSLFDYLKVKLNIWTTNEKTWPLLVFNSIVFIKDLTPPLDVQRQKDILSSVLVPLILLSISIGGSAHVGTRIKPEDAEKRASRRKYVEQCVAPMINIHYDDYKDPYADSYDKNALANSKPVKTDKCCIIC